MTGALSGLRVLEIARNVSGPYASRLLAEQGADIIKVEPPGGDPSRAYGPFPEDDGNPEKSGLFLHLNRNKRSIVLDPSSADGAGIIRALASEVDILIEDYAPGEAARWGWGYETLANRNPRLVMTSITSFGQTGPYKDYRGSEITLQAIGGPLHANGFHEREPLKLGGQYAHFHTGITAALATLIASRRAESSGQGDWIDISVYECQAGCRDRRSIQLTIAAYTGMAGGRLRNTTRGFGVGVRKCADGYVNIMGAGAKRLPRLLQMIGESEVAKTIDPNNLTDSQKVQLEERYQLWLDKRGKKEVVETAQSNGLLAGAFNSIADVVDDPHYDQRKAWDEVTHPVAGKLKYPGRPFVMSASARRRPTAAPLLDEHGQEIRNRTTGPTTTPAKTGRISHKDLPLSGLRVAEITVVWAGPHVTQLLGEWGADVIRVEPSNKIQPFTRGMERVPNQKQIKELVGNGAPIGFPNNDPGSDPWNRTAAFNSHARNKRSMACDIMHPEGREAVLKLVEHCDILVENNVPETIDKAELDWETLHAINPRLIMLRMPAFALSGPYSHFRAFGLHVEAMIGHTSLRGYPDAGPEILSESLASDGISGVQGALAVLMALREREATGKGQLIELPLTEGFLPTLGEFVMDYTMNNRDTPTQGNQHRRNAPHNVYPCNGLDNWIAIDIDTDQEFIALCRVLNLNLGNDPRFSNRNSRYKHRNELDKLIGSITLRYEKEELFHELQKAGVCAAPTHNGVEALNDPHLNARGFFEELPTGRNREIHRYPGLMWKMKHTPNKLQTGPVLLGEHNQEIYCELLGYSLEKLQSLIDRELVGDSFPKTIWEAPTENGANA